jgi:ketosteroid isomerase-like protein
LPREIAAREIRENSNSEFLEVIDDAQKARDIYIHLAESIDNEGLLLFANSMAEVLNSVVEDNNTGDLNSLITLYEADACFASQPRQHAKSPDGIRQSLRSFIDKGKLDLKIKRVLQASDLALVITEWSFSGTGSDGNPVNMTA